MAGQCCRGQSDVRARVGDRRAEQGCAGTARRSVVDQATVCGAGTPRRATGPDWWTERSSAPSLSRCTPGSCGAFFCDWETGECLLDAGSAFNSYQGKVCLTDYDCATAPLLNPVDDFPGSFCDPVSHRCNACNTDADCAGVSAAVGLHCFKLDAGDSTCGCLSDADCAGLAATKGPHCFGADAAGSGSCGCSSDADCTGNPAGSGCDTISSTRTLHSCGCLTPRDCQPDQACLASFLALTSTACGTLCASDSDCNSGYACDPDNTCRARCDGNACPAPQPVCDGADTVGQNGRTAAGYRRKHPAGQSVPSGAA